MHIEPGTQDVSISIWCRDTDGGELTGKVAADFTLTYRRAGALVPITLSDLTALTDAHTDGGIKEVGHGEYRLDLPDAACAIGAIQVTVQGSVAGGYVLGYPHDLSATTGTGPYACTWTVNDGATALQNAVVSFTMAGALKGRGTTNASGQASMSLAAGTYTVAISCDGYTFATTTHTVSATASTWTAPFSMTTVTITAPSSSANATGRLDMHKSDTTADPYASIFVRKTARREATGHGDSKAWRELVADSNGVIQAEFVKSESYEAKRGKDGTPVAFTVDANQETFYLPSILGEP